MNKKEEPTVSIVIPCYQSEKIIENVVDEIIEVTSGLNIIEIILVDDGSPDQVWEKIETLTKKYDCVNGILFARNFGQHSALMAGYRMATGDFIVTMDDDGQSDPNGIRLLIDKIVEGYDVVYAKYPKFEKTAFRKFGSYMNRVMAESMIDKPKGIQANSFYIMRKFVKDEIIRYEHSYPYIGGLVFRATQNITEVEINHRNRAEGNSGYNLRKLLLLWLNGFTEFSIKPLRLASYIGILCSLVGFAIGIYSIIRRLLNPNILMGYSSLFAAITFIGGIIMMMMGMMGEYIGRIYISINCSPQYVIKTTIQKKADIQDKENSYLD